MPTRKKISFDGFDEFVCAPEENFPPPLPHRIRIVDSKERIEVNVDLMTIRGDQCVENFRLRDASQSLSRATQEIFFYVVVDALNGKRKVSTTHRWVSEFRLFLNIIYKITRSPISTITLAMFNHYSQDRGASQKKLIRSFLQYWRSLNLPGLSVDLRAYLAVSRAPKATSTIETQNNKPEERPFSIPQIRTMTARVDDNYIAHEFNPQENLLWKLIISEALRPTQFRLLQIRDVEIKSEMAGGLSDVTLHIPVIKQKGRAGRDLMVAHTLPYSAAQAMRDQLEYIKEILAEDLPPTLPLFCIVRRGRFGAVAVQKSPISIVNLIKRSRKRIANGIAELEDNDLFCRRFKHTKLTHLAVLGAPLAVLARSGFQTSTISLRHYVNLTSEAFAEYEAIMKTRHEQLNSHFKGQVINKDEATHTDRHHRIEEASIDGDLGACADDPCNINAPIGCFDCMFFQAFDDGPHEEMREIVVHRKERAIKMNLSHEVIDRENATLAAIDSVIIQIKETNQT